MTIQRSSRNAHVKTRSPGKMRDLNFEPRSTVRRANTPQLRHAIAGFCRTAMEDYREAGYPFGKTLDGMLIWFEYGQRSTDN